MARVTPVFDSRRDDLPYHLTTTVNGRTVDFQKPMPDPFHSTTLTTRWGWRDRLRILFGRPTTVGVSVGGSRPVVEAVSELDANYRGATGSDRRREADAEMDRAIRAHIGSSSEGSNSSPQGQTRS